MKVQFLLKRNLNYNFISYCRRSSGLWNSTRFIVEALAARGIHTEIIELHDGNDIDREVTRFNPDIVVIEALWVTPEKAKELTHLHRHKHRKWFVHMHSGLPFLALEGIAMDWLSKYPSAGLGVIANSPETFEAFSTILPEGFVKYLPNVYIPKFHHPVEKNRTKGHFSIACFGAMRPMKNHLTQAIAAIRFANSRGKSCHFHINASRVEVGGAPVLKNLRQLFEHQTGHKLVEHHWMEPDDLIEFLHQHIDIGMQVSLTETFNVVTADYVTAGIPCVVSKEVPWSSRWNKADDDSIDDIVRVMNRVMRNRCLIKWNQRLLQQASLEAQDLWLDWVRSLDS